MALALLPGRYLPVPPVIGRASRGKNRGRWDGKRKTAWPATAREGFPLSPPKSALFEEILFLREAERIDGSRWFAQPVAARAGSLMRSA